MEKTVKMEKPSKSGDPAKATGGCLLTALGMASFAVIIYIIGVAWWGW